MNIEQQIIAAAFRDEMEKIAKTFKVRARPLSHYLDAVEDGAKFPKGFDRRLEDAADQRKIEASYQRWKDSTDSPRSEGIGHTAADEIDRAISETPSWHLSTGSKATPTPEQWRLQMKSVVKNPPKSAGPGRHPSIQGGWPESLSEKLRRLANTEMTPDDGRGNALKSIYDAIRGR